MSLYYRPVGDDDGAPWIFRALQCAVVEHCTVPKRRTAGLTTWNDVFFPLTWPCWVEKGDRVCLHFVRRKNKEAVWYEWALS